MSQKPTKNSNRLVNGLKDKIKDLENDVDYYKILSNTRCDEIKKLESTVESFNNIENRLFDVQRDSLAREIENLKEIIRWLIKPATAQWKDVEKDRPSLKY